MHRLPLLLLALVAAVLAGGPASALTTTSLQQVVQELRADRVVVAPGFEVEELDEASLRPAVLGADVQLYVAAVPAVLSREIGSDALLVDAILSELTDPNAVVLVITDKPSVYADSGPAITGRGVRPGAAVDANNGRGEFDEASITAFVEGFAATVDAQASGRSGAGGSGGGTGAPAGIVPLLAVLALGGGGYALVRSRRSKRDSQKALEDARADVESLYGRLGSDVQLLAPGDDAIARQALADAGERYNATGALMAKADTLGEYAAARRTAVEGIAAARVVRARLGLDPGPDVPLPPGSGPQLEAPARVRVGDQEYEGSPQYEPERPHYYEGGYYGSQRIPGGWYATPFWQTLLLSSVLRGGTVGGYRRRSYGGYHGGGIGGGIGGGMLGGGISGRGRGLGGGRRGGFGGGFGGGGGWGGGGGRGGGGSW